MNRLCTLSLCAALIAATPFATTLSAQTPAAKPAQASPAEVAKGTIGGVDLTINYCSPRVNGRVGKLFGPGGRISKDPHYPVWRGGANAATTLNTYAPLKFGDILVPAGTHTLFVDVSDPDHWTLIVSNDTGEWGLSYNSAKDLGHTKMMMSVPHAMIEDLRYTIMPTGANKGRLTLAWENHVASVVISKP